MEFEIVELGDEKALLIETREDAFQIRKNLPKGLYAYDLRHGDNGDPCTIEKTVGVNYFGTVITKKPFKEIETDPEACVPIETYLNRYDDDGNLIDCEIDSPGIEFGYTDEEMSIEEFRRTET